MAEKTVKVQLVRGLAGKSKKNIRTLEGLGLYKLNQIKEHKDTPSIRGMIKAVQHFLKIIEN